MFLSCPANKQTDRQTTMKTAPLPNRHCLLCGFLGPRPEAPYNVSVQQIGSDLMIKWNISQHPGSVPVDHYVVQYRTVGQWVPLSSSVAANTTWFLWGTASRGAFYHFRVFAVGKQAHSDASKVVSLRTGGQADRLLGLCSSLYDGRQPRRIVLRIGHTRQSSIHVVDKTSVRFSNKFVRLLVNCQNL